jgi:hypothetical protein
MRTVRNFSPLDAGTLMKRCENKVFRDRIGPYVAWVRLIKWQDDEPIVEQMLNAGSGPLDLARFYETDPQ